MPIAGLPALTALQLHLADPLSDPLSDLIPVLQKLLPVDLRLALETDLQTGRSPDQPLGRRQDLRIDLQAGHLDMTDRFTYVRTIDLIRTGFTHVREISLYMTDRLISGQDIITATDIESGYCLLT